jgi:hypothetical protein
MFYFFTQRNIAICGADFLYIVRVKLLKYSKFLTKYRSYIEATSTTIFWYFKVLCHCLF